MEYRELPHGGEKIGVIGLGAAQLGTTPHDEAVATYVEAVRAGVNLMDLAAGHAPLFSALADALSELGPHAREGLYFQVHYGANYQTPDAEYGWTARLEDMRRSVAWELETLGTDYIDFAFIHCIDEASDLGAFVRSGALDHLRDLRAQGVVRHLGLSTHSPELAGRVLDLGEIDLMMFSVNPVYDYGEGAYGLGTSAERQTLYQRCAEEGVGISVMKAFAGGQLLDAAQSPFGRALTRYQCLRYALDTPGVVCVVPGVRDRADLRALLGFFDAPAAEKDYSVLNGLAPEKVAGRCVYCNHCAPCPQGINVGLVNKYYDLALAGDVLAADHYAKLDRHAGDCVGCGYCDARCPFGVAQSARMREVATHFGR